MHACVCETERGRGREKLQKYPPPPPPLLTPPPIPKKNYKQES